MINYDEHLPHVSELNRLAALGFNPVEGLRLLSYEKQCNDSYYWLRSQRAKYLGVNDIPGYFFPIKDYIAPGMFKPIVNEATKEVLQKWQTAEKGHQEYTGTRPPLMTATAEALGLEHLLTSAQSATEPSL